MRQRKAVHVPTPPSIPGAAWHQRDLKEASVFVSSGVTLKHIELFVVHTSSFIHEAQPIHREKNNAVLSDAKWLILNHNQAGEGKVKVTFS